VEISSDLLTGAVRHDDNRCRNHARSRSWGPRAAATVKVLLAWGADPTARANGQTPFEMTPNHPTCKPLPKDHRFTIQDCQEVGSQLQIDSACRVVVWACVSDCMGWPCRHPAVHAHSIQVMHAHVPSCAWLACAPDIEGCQKRRR
jgi:hypothetical protein